MHATRKTTTTTSTTHHHQKIEAKPSRIHASMQNMAGSLQSAIGRVTHNPTSQIKGQEKQVRAKAEMDLAKLHTAKRFTEVGLNRHNDVRKASQ
ncbi:hypothetical protein HDU90_002971 [Geranomyces variabilis]|nr:hypothetical protein HDU90_002971 [Geranomyces variabilis]